MQWARVKYHIDESVGEVPFSFIEHSSIKEILENSKQYVFWSSNANITHESLLEKQGKIAYADKIKRSTSKRRITGYYMVTILQIAGMYAHIEHKISSKSLLDMIELLMFNRRLMEVSCR